MRRSVARLSRQGRVAEAADGCASIEVSVPCSGCRQSGCAQRRDAGRFTVQDAELPVGNHVIITLARRDLTAACVKLFGPGLLWLLLLAAAGSSAVSGALSTGASLLFGLGGLLLALLLGRRLARDDEIVPEIRALGSQGGEARITTQITVQESG